MKPETLIANRYEILGPIGKGGMGSVYKVMDLKVNRVMAVKLLSSEHLTDPTNIERFKREAMAAASLSHPHLAGVYDYGLLSDGSPYLVMEFLSGESVADTIKKRGSLSVDSVLKISTQICKALGYAHAQRIVHRDLKPSNIMLLDQAADEFIKVVDFGIMKFITAEMEEAAKLTGTGEVFGSPLYMSPEQCRGDQLDGRTDIYSLGCMMYEMLMGVPPFNGKSPIQTICMHLQEQAEPFLAIRPNLQIDSKLERAIFCCLEKDPDRRFQSMEDLGQNLRSISSKDERKSSKALPLPANNRSQVTQSNDKTAVSGALENCREDNSSPIVSKSTQGSTSLHGTGGATNSNSRINTIVVATASLLFIITGIASGVFLVEKFAPKDSSNQPTSLPNTVSATPFITPSNSKAIDAEEMLERSHPVLEVTNQLSGGKPAVEMIAVYMGKGTPRTVVIDVKRTAPTIVVLNSYQNVIWDLHKAPGAKIEKIVLSGYNGQSIKGADGINVISSFYQDAHGNRLKNQPFQFTCGSLLFDNNKDFANSSEYSNFATMAKAATGENITHFQGRYMSGAFVIK